MMHAPIAHFLRGRRSETGAAAIELALIFPVIVLLYIGLIDLNGYVSVTRRVANSASILSDLVTQSELSVSAATIDDAFAGAKMAMRPVTANAIGAEIRNYRLVNDAVTEQWRRVSATGPACGAPDLTGLRDIMVAGNDILIASICTVHEPAMSQLLGKQVLGATSFTIQSQVRLRPRESLTLNCIGC